MEIKGEYYGWRLDAEIKNTRNHFLSKGREKNKKV